MNALERRGFERLAEGQLFLAQGALFANYVTQPITQRLDIGASGRKEPDSWRTWTTIRDYVKGKARIRYRNRTVWPGLAGTLSGSWSAMFDAAGGIRFSGGSPGEPTIVWWPGSRTDLQKTPTPQQMVTRVAEVARAQQDAADADPNLKKAQELVAKRWKAGEAILRGEVERWQEGLCDKCGGLGFISSYSHVDGGQCWDCGGTGLKDP